MTPRRNVLNDKVKAELQVVEEEAQTLNQGEEEAGFQISLPHLKQLVCQREFSSLLQHTAPKKPAISPSGFSPRYREATAQQSVSSPQHDH